MNEQFQPDCEQKANRKVRPLLAVIVNICIAFAVTTVLVGTLIFLATWAYWHYAFTHGQFAS